MSDFTSTMTYNTSVGDSLITLWNDQTLFEAQSEMVADQLATVRVNIGAETINFPKFNQITVTVSALTDKADPSSTEITDSKTYISPLEHGAVVTYTQKANFAAGGRVDLAATKLIGAHMGKYQDVAAITELEAFSTDIIYPNTVAAASSLSDGDVLDKTLASRLYNRLARKNIPGVLGTEYFAIAHDDCLHDLREDVGAGSWVNVSQYSNLTQVLKNEIGMYKGIRWIRSSNVTVTADSNGTIDSYKVMVLGANALGKAVSKEPSITVTSTDKLGRFVNVGWWGIFGYGVVDTNNMVLGICASSVGDNS